VVSALLLIVRLEIKTERTLGIAAARYEESEMDRPLFDQDGADMAKGGIQYAAFL